MSIFIGQFIEKKASDYLKNQGLRFLERNFRSRWGEIDLIMQDKEHLVFVEVRSRTRQDYGGALTSITYQKQQKIIKTALDYLRKKKLVDRCAVRFDVVGIEGDGPIQWVKNAFDGY